MTLLSIPPFTEEIKSRFPERTKIYGQHVASNGLIKALLQHGNYDCYYFLCSNPQAIQEAEKDLVRYSNQERTELVLLDEYGKLKSLDQMILFSPSQQLYLLGGMRRLHGRVDWPATGLTHSLSGNGNYLAYALQGILGDIYAYDSLICTSQAGRSVAEKFIGSLCDYLGRKYGASFFPKCQFPVIPLGTDADTFQPGDKIKARKRCQLPEDHVILLYVGRLCSRTKIDLFPLVLAFLRIVAKTTDKNITLVLAGDDVGTNVASRLRSFGDDLCLSDNLVIRPNITSEEKYSLYNAADIFVALSDNVQETFGLSVLEAMSSGLPVIASDWDGYKETIKHGETGFLVPTYLADCIDHVSRSAMLRDTEEVHRDLSQAVSIDINALIGYIGLLTENESLRREMGEAGRRRVLKHYNWPVIIRAYEGLWADMLERSSQSSTDGEFQHGLYTYDYMEVFQHYSTGVITKCDKFRITPTGREFLDNSIDAQALMHTELSDSLHLVTNILTACKDAGDARISDLIGETDDETEKAASDTFRTAARLVKYGFLDVR
jgi:glycosyltransferase involved in cell wall biosynthesis